MKLSKRVSLFLLIGMPIFAFSEAGEGVHVYPPVPGLEPSEHYSFKVRTQGSDKWIDAFAFVTTCKSGGCLLYTSPSPRDRQKSRMPSSA